MNKRIPADDRAIEKALTEVNLPVLLQVMATLDCANPLDSEWLTEKWAPTPIVAPEGSLIPDDSGGYSEEQSAQIRAAALELLVHARDSESEPQRAPNLDTFQRMMSFSIAEPMERDFAAMLLEETGFVDRDAQWQTTLRQAQHASTASSTATNNFKVIIIGAGMSGIGMAAKLKGAGIDFEILEKNAAVGGTWFENRYPDCGVDTPNHFYSYSFNRNPDWSGYFSKRDELYSYFEKCADDFGVREHIRFNTEVEKTVYDAGTRQWHVSATDNEGKAHELIANVVISAVGQLNRPNLPDITGRDTFAGHAFHSARWQDINFDNKRVGVIGTGCSAVQLLPKTAQRAAKTSVFQRTPHWVSPVRDYYRKVEEGTRWALNYIPQFAQWHRARMVFAYADRNWEAVVADPQWQNSDQSMNEMSEGMRQALAGYIVEELGPKAHLAPQCTPDFPVWGKRLIIDNNWYQTLARNDVALVSSGIEEIIPEGIRTADGELHKLDILIFATGFQSNLFLWPMEVIGKSGETLSHTWGDDPEAYRGITVPDYPNLFCLYGPNTNIVHGGSIIYQVECQIHYIMQCLASMITGELSSLEVKDAVNTEYNERVQSISRQLAWGHAGVSSWYKNGAGKVVNNSPFSLHQYWQETHELSLDDYLQEPA